MILTHILVNKFSFSAKDVEWTGEMTDWGDSECKRVGQAFANFLRKRKTGDAAVDAWRLQYGQLEVLFEKVIGFEDFMVTLANSLLKDSFYGTAYRVTVGASLSTIDAATDIYVIATYVGERASRENENKEQSDDYNCLVAERPFSNTP